MEKVTISNISFLKSPFRGKPL